MSAPPFRLSFTPEAQSILERIRSTSNQRTKWTKIQKTLRLLQDVGPSYPGLHAHKYSSLTGPAGEEVWECYVENHTPGAWRMFWIYGPEADTITVLTVGPHPD